MAGKLGGGGHKKGMQPNAEPNVIPFIDIMLVMLIIFMVAAPLPTVDIKVDLPPPGKVIVIEQADKPTIVRLLDYSGTRVLYIEDTLVPEDQFGDTLLRIARARNPTNANDYQKLFEQAKIFVDADQETEYKNVIEVINEIDQAGFKKVSLLVKDAAS